MAAPRREDGRIIIHFDYDCFYASVFEAEQPVLKSLPLAVQQKQIVVTCNYEARRRGLRKLQLIKEAKQVCPEVVIVLGEDLTRFRNASKELYLYLRGFVWGEKVEKLGFDEVFFDVSDMITYNVEMLNRNDLEHSFFHLDRRDPTVGFMYDATAFKGHTYPAVPNPAANSQAEWLRTRLLVASHLANYLRNQLEYQKGYTATVGISTSKLLAKLVGNTHKPNSQTTLLPPYTAAEHTAESNVIEFLDTYEIRKIPGIGSKIAHKLMSYLIAAESKLKLHHASAPGTRTEDRKVTVKSVRLFPGMGPLLLDRILGGPGAPKGIGARIWGLIHGVDNTEVLQARDLPTQISIEDSYGRLDNFEEVRRALVTLTASLIRRMRVDLTEADVDTSTATGEAPAVNSPNIRPKLRWLAHPKTLRLSTCPRPAPNSEKGQDHSFSRISRSAPLPSYIFNLDENVDALAERLVQESAMSMFRKLHPEKSGWNLRVLNVAVTNLVETAGDQRNSSGRDIGKMFRLQEATQQDEFTSQLEGAASSGKLQEDAETPHQDRAGAGWESDEDEDMPAIACTICGAWIPQFAMLAHGQYHNAPDD
ncbi:putative DNA polymerase iota [Aspergillus clavatus NRRL 1]|uniref:DNA polymerase iota, putative n=1 Tax=Aspergillus clavatus (strain ATCC 1007 / CBS 513.65 / DSM 816 / NCTC 3887 / NRRL 1 / QM 1276 / 107) TaxID=344612 RepID=A1CI46_ASPCL|nr:DNA polymerase iota, putative [Aspergillus clavatus NRRL 1]EAW10551.1 DNA polymerase iota, putative [Aspergillus clavatus NRRL 1]